MFEYLKKYLKTKDVEYKENKILAEISPIKIGGSAKIIIFPKDKCELCETLAFLGANKIAYIILGNMSNVLPRDDEYFTVIVKTDKLRRISQSGCSIFCECGVKLPILSAYLINSHLSGFEELSGIPGQIGGAIYGNAGAFGREISDIVVGCTVYDNITEKVYNLDVSELAFSYRKSIFIKKELTVISVQLKFSLSDKNTVERAVKKFKEKRVLSQPMGKPSLGSIFKRPALGVSAGKLIDECGLRGFSFGGAAISEKHAGFIVNRNGAKSEEVKYLVDLARKSVKEKFGFELEREIEYL